MTCHYKRCIGVGPSIPTFVRTNYAIAKETLKARSSRSVDTSDSSDDGHDREVSDDFAELEKRYPSMAQERPQHY